MAGPCALAPLLVGLANHSNHTLAALASQGAGGPVMEVLGELAEEIHGVYVLRSLNQVLAYG